MLQGIIAVYNRLPKTLVRFIDFIPVLLSATYLVFVTAILLPLAVAICVVVVPLLYVLWRVQNNRFNPVFLRIMYPFELVGTTIVNSPQIVAAIVDRTRKIKRPVMSGVSLNTIKVNRSKAMIMVIRILAILGVAGVVVYMVAVAAVVLPLALGACLVVAPFCYLAWYVKEKKFIPLFYKIPTYLEQLGFTIVNSRKIMSNLVLGLKNFKWPMF